MEDPTPPLTTSSSPISTPAPPTPAPQAVEEICTKAHVEYCMDVLLAQFEGGEPAAPRFRNGNDK
jgi:hypothetical protein